MLTKIKKWQ